MKKFTSKSQKTGEIGEELACKFLVKHGFTIFERNYTKKWGEIDIVATKNGVLHFFEVKAGVTRVTSKQVFVKQENDVTRVTFQSNSEQKSSVTRVTLVNNVSHETFRPEENLHPGKLKRLFKTVETYLIERKIGEKPWQIDVAIVSLDLEKRVGKVKILENIGYE